MHEAPTLRKLPLVAREQIRSLEEAEKRGAFLCPTEDQEDRTALAPFCAFVLKATHGGFESAVGIAEGDENGDGGDCPTPVPPTAASSLTQPLHHDEDLVLLKRGGDEDDGDDADAAGKAGATTKKKTNKARKEKIVIPIQLAQPEADRPSPPPGPSSRPPSAPAPSQAHAPSWPGAGAAAGVGGGVGGGIAAAWGAAAQQQRLAASAAAASKPPSLGSGPAPEVHGTAATAAASFMNRLAQGRGGVAASLSTNVASEGNSLPARTSIESERREAGAVRQLVGLCQCSEAKAAQLLESARGSVEAACDAFFQQSAQPTAASIVAGRGAKPLGGANGPSGGNNANHGSREPPASTHMPEGWQAVWSEEEKDFYYWHVPSNKVQWEVPGGAKSASHGAPPAPAKKVAADNSSDLLQQLMNITDCSHEEAKRLLKENAGNLEAAIRAHAAQAGEAASSGSRKVAKPAKPVPEAIPLGEYVCTQHWQEASAQQDSCLKLLHGERVRVQWTDNNPGGWALAILVHEPEKRGYCPQAVLALAPPAVKSLPKGSRRVCSEKFEAPKDTLGYLSLAIGDEVVIEHAVEEPCVWAYVSRLRNRRGPGSTDAGWVPVSVLDAHVGGPHG